MAEAILPLDGKRTIILSDKGFTYKFHFSRILQPDWERYFSSIDFKSRNAGSAEETTLDFESGAVRLAEDKLESVEGYAGEFTSKPDWRTKIPPRHLRPVALQLLNVSESRVESEKPFDPESIEIALDAFWSNEDPEKQFFRGLVHRFSPVTIEQKRRFFKAGATSKVVGGARNGTTIHATRHNVLLKIYDELIQSVDGYSVNGQPLTSPEQIKREMDGLHKVRAAELLFAGAGDPAAEAKVEAA